MRISIVHSFYRADSPSGENEVVSSQASALRNAGHEVDLVSTYSDALKAQLGRAYEPAVALQTATGVGRSPLSRLEAFDPDVVHVHNLFPNYGESWMARWPGPVVVTLHNYRSLCAAGTLFREGQSCTACPDGERWAGVKHGCYHDSAVATVPLAWRNRKGPSGVRSIRDADSLIALSERARDIYVDYGVDTESVTVIPNFVRIDDAADSTDSTRLPVEFPRWLYVGRLSDEKGILDLAAQWIGDFGHLDLVGDGPNRLALENLNNPSVSLLGMKDNREVRLMMKRYTGLLFPSKCAEGLPTVYLEALVNGLPVIATMGSSAGDKVTAEGTGIAIPLPISSRDLSPALHEVHLRRSAYSAAATSAFRQKYSESSWLEAIGNLYKSVATVERRK